jgi:DNA polymerase
MNYQNCTSCALCLNRKNVVRGDGEINAQLILLGEAPGSTEDKTGLPFTGRAGKLLDTILSDVGFNKKDLYITNIVKCRPPYNRVPNESEITNCYNKFLSGELAHLTNAKIYLLLGATVSQVILGQPLNKSRKTIFPIGDKIIVTTYHPTSALKDDYYKNCLYADMNKVMEYYKYLNPFYNIKYK